MIVALRLNYEAALSAIALESLRDKQSLTNNCVLQQVKHNGKKLGRLPSLMTYFLLKKAKLIKFNFVI